MPFRANEAIIAGYDRAAAYLIPRKFSPSDRSKAEKALRDIVAECGPVVETYPTWHPLVMNRSERSIETTPNDQCGYEGLDHTIYMVNGFVTCPYGDGQNIIDAVERLEGHHAASITATKLDAPFYNSGTTPILVQCEWSFPLEEDGSIPKSLAVPLMLEHEVPCWRWAQRAETWETMRPYLLGRPHGNRSSLFVNQDTALAMKKIFLAMVESGMFGP